MTSELSVKSVLFDAKKELKEVPVDEPESSAEFLLCHVLSISRSQLYGSPDRKLTKKELKEYRKLVGRRKKHEPVYQITGKVGFWGINFEINGNVLVPRPETEFLVQEVLKEVKEKKNLKILDVGTGAGPIIIALSKELLGNKFYASDISKEALKIAKKNAGRNEADKCIEFRAGELLKPWEGMKFDIITANLPYIPHEDLPGLTVEIYHHEPRIALDGGPGGLVIYKEFLKELPRHLNNNVVIFCEIGKDQGKLFTNIVQKYLPNTKCNILQDLAGFDRIAVVKRGVK